MGWAIARVGLSGVERWGERRGAAIHMPRWPQTHTSQPRKVLPSSLGRIAGELTTGDSVTMVRVCCCVCCACESSRAVVGAARPKWTSEVAAASARCVLLLLLLRATSEERSNIISLRH